MDHLSRILIRFASREPAPRVFYDPPGTPRVEIAWAGFEQLLDTAFEQIRMYTKGDQAVSLRLLRALGDIASTTPDKGFHKALQERGKRIVDGCAERLTEAEIQPLRVRLGALSGQ